MLLQCRAGGFVFRLHDDPPFVFPLTKNIVRAGCFRKPEEVVKFYLKQLFKSSLKAVEKPLAGASPVGRAAPEALRWRCPRTRPYTRTAFRRLVGKVAICAVAGGHKPARLRHNHVFYTAREVRRGVRIQIGKGA
jgi:hypothetical protein